MSIRTGLLALGALALVSTGEAQEAKLRNLPVSASQFNLCLSEPSPSASAGSQCIPFATVDRGSHSVRMLPAFAQGVISAVGLSGQASDLAGSLNASALPTLAATGGTINGTIIGGANPADGSFKSATARGLTASEFQGGPGNTAGTTWTTQYHGDWSVLQSNTPYNPTEWQVYTNAANGLAQVLAGTNQVVLSRGTPFDTSWIGHPYFYFEGVLYTVSSVLDANHLTVTTTTGGAVSFPSTINGTYYYSVTTTTAQCNVVGSTVSYVSGQKFTPIFDSFWINGAQYPASFTDTTHMALSSNLNLTGATCVAYANINNELSNLRLQGLWGGPEENFVITETPAAAIIQTTYAQGGNYRPIIIKNGEQPAGNQLTMAGFYPNSTIGGLGFITLGGGTDLNNEALAIQPNSNNRNFLLVQGATPGNVPSLAARGADANVGLDFDVQGASTISFTSHSYGQNEFQIFGVGGTSWLAVGSDTGGNPFVVANGAAANINVALRPKGTGVVASSGPVQLPSYTVASLPACNSATRFSMAVATDITTRSYGAVAAGGGSLSSPVFCDGSSWSQH